MLCQHCDDVRFGSEIIQPHKQSLTVAVNNIVNNIVGNQAKLGTIKTVPIKDKKQSADNIIPSKDNKPSEDKINPNKDSNVTLHEVIKTSVTVGNDIEETIGLVQLNIQVLYKYTTGEA